MLTLYRFLINLFYPLIVVIIFLRKLIGKEDPIRYKEKIFVSHFKVNRKNKTKLIWFHAASVGEVKSILPIVKELTKNNNLEILITTVTLSSSKIIKDKIHNHKNIHHRFFPIDATFIIENFLSLWRPNAVFLVDSEIWPNLISLVKKKKISLAIINARITRKTFDRWNLVPNFAKEIFNKFNLCLASNEETKTFLQKLNANNIFCLGNIKLIDKLNNEPLKNINHEMLRDKPIWCAASTHKNEEKFCLEVHKKLKEKYSNLITVIAPRHIERYQEIKKICLRFGLNTQVLNKNDLINKEKEIIILNSFGDLPKYFKYAKSVFIGKTLLKKFEKVGGQNPIDAARLGCKVYHGPYIYNFREIFEILKSHQISYLVKTTDVLANFLVSDLNAKKIDNKNFLLTLNRLQQKIFTNTMIKINKLLSNEF